MQLQASVLALRATRLCVCLIETGGEAAKERLQFSSRRFVRAFLCDRVYLVTASTSTQVMGLPEMGHRLLVEQSRGKEALENCKSTTHPSDTHRRGSHKLVGCSVGWETAIRL